MAGDAPSDLFVTDLHESLTEIDMVKRIRGARTGTEIEVSLTDEAEARVIKNLWPLYQHDVSELEPGLAPNRHGILGADDAVTTLAEHAGGLDAWWREPGSLFPYVIRVDGRAVGFDLVAARPHVPAGIDADFVVHELFVLCAYRGNGVAERAVVEVFDRHRGTWAVLTWPGHGRAIAFWRRVVGGYARRGHTEAEVDVSWGRRVALVFDNGRP